MPHCLRHTTYPSDQIIMSECRLGHVERARLLLQSLLPVDDVRRPRSRDVIRGRGVAEAEHGQRALGVCQGSRPSAVRDM